MSVAYLQRLIDRAAPLFSQTRFVESSGVSVSPVANADQRLNDPRFAEDFSFYAGGFQEGEVDDAPRDTPMPPPTARNVDTSIAGPDNAPPRPPATRQDSIPLNDATRPTLGDQTATPAMSVGQVLEDDFVPPEPIHVDHVLEPQVDPQAVPPIQTAPKPIVKRDAIPRPPRVDVAPPPHADSPRKTRVSVPESRPMEAAMKAAPAEPRPIEPVVPAPFTVPKRPLAEQQGPEPQSPVEAIPAGRPPIPEPRPIPADVEAFAASPPPASTPVPAPEKKTEPGRQSTPPRQPRPMTAAEASIIGPLARRPRAVTLFGLRRR